MQLKTVSKNLLSVFIAMMLALSLVPTVAYADEESSETGEAQDGSIEWDQSSNSEEVEESDTSATNLSEFGQGDYQSESDIQDEKELSAITSDYKVLSDDQAFEFIYIDQKAVTLNATQSIVISFVDANNADTAELYYQQNNGEISKIKPKQIEDGAALFELTFTSNEQLGTYRLIKVTWSGENPGEADIPLMKTRGIRFL